MFNTTKFFIVGVCLIGFGVLFDQGNQLLTFTYCTLMLLLGTIEYKLHMQDKSIKNAFFSW
jgi:hypothetical protein